jgi:hypothetical protein
MNLYAATGADLIFYKPVSNGTMYMLKFKKANEKQHSTVNNCIVKLDDTLKLNGGKDTLYFLSINNDDSLPGSKVLSFDRVGRKRNPLYMQLFGRKGSLLPGVSVWNMETKDAAQLGGNNSDGILSTASKGDPSSAESFEFDVVKKRKAMEDPVNSDDPSSAEALTAFEDFELSVLPAIENIRADEEIVRRMEMLQMEDDMLQGKFTATGGVYFAWSDCLCCMKIGATRKDSPVDRLKELSRHVTSPFTLAAWLPTPTPFRQEAAAHAHFKDKRINARNCGSGAGTEFFHVSTAEAAEWVAAV